MSYIYFILILLLEFNHISQIFYENYTVNFELPLPAHNYYNCALQMATLEALAISGIRGYNPQKLERIDFTHPLTLICGKNGSGKTTIIECLKYITTGVLPPSTKAEKSFIMDPSIAGTPEVKGDIRLRFRTAKNRVVIAKKILLISKTLKGLTSRAVQQSLKTKDEKGQQIQVSQRCADIEKQIPQMLGISKAILDNIVFCHQDESLWPFSDNNTLKGIFDELFDTKRFTKAVQNMKQAIKDYQKERLQLKGQMDYLKAAYYKMVQNRNQTLEGLLEIVQASQQVYKIRQELVPLRTKLKEKESKQTIKNDLISKKGVTQFKITDLNESLEKLQSKAKQLQVNITDVQRNVAQAYIKEIEEGIIKKEKERKTLQNLVQQIKDKQNTHKRKIEFHMQIKRIKQIMPQLNEISPATADAISKRISQKLGIMKKNQKQLKECKEKINKLTLSSLPMEYEKQDYKSYQSKLQRKKNDLQALEKRIRLMYNGLYDPNVLGDGSGITGQSKKAEEKLNKLKAQIELKKSELKKYQEIKPINKSIEQQIFEMRYAGIQLQKQMLEFIKRKRSCMLCMKSLSDQDLQDIKSKIAKTIKKSQGRIQQLNRNYNPINDIDPTPIIKQIQAFIDSTTKTMRFLQEEKQKYDKYVACQHQVQLNKQLNRLMQSIEMKAIMQKQSTSKSDDGNTIEKFRQLVNQYRLLNSEYRNMSGEAIRIRQRTQRIEQIKKQYTAKVQERSKFESQIQKLQSSIKNLNIIQNIYERVKQLNELIKRDEAKGSSSEQSTPQLINRVDHIEQQIRNLNKDKLGIELSMEHKRMCTERQELREMLKIIIDELNEIMKLKNENVELENKKNCLQIQQAKLSSKIELKKLLYSKYLQEDPTYLNKLLRYNALNSMIADINTTVKAMERATNKLHNEKMDQINKILYDIWQEVYNAKDIQFIRINSIAEKKNNGYGYSIMMQKNGQLIEMKGRCSMGQKVLASIIIRMALAQAFSASTHILTLDEPTTNLDRVHIENLAESISSIIEMEQNSRLQLIIISHDLEFIALLKKHTNFYYEISRNQKNFSTIVRKQISQLGIEDKIPRPQAIHY